MTSVAALRFCLLTGCRPGEALAAKWEDVDLAARVWKLPAAKTGPRAVYMGQAAVDVLSGLTKDGPWLFSGRVDGAALTSLRALWERVAERAELGQGLRLYGATRHTFATMAAELEVPRDARQLLMGMQSAGTRTIDTCMRPGCSYGRPTSLPANSPRHSGVKRHRSRRYYGSGRPAHADRAPPPVLKINSCSIDCISLCWGEHLRLSNRPAGPKGGFL